MSHAAARQHIEERPWALCFARIKCRYSVWQGSGASSWRHRGTRQLGADRTSRWRAALTCWPIDCPGSATLTDSQRSSSAPASFRSAEFVTYSLIFISKRATWLVESASRDDCFPETVVHCFPRETVHFSLPQNFAEAGIRSDYLSITGNRTSARDHRAQLYWRP